MTRFTEDLHHVEPNEPVWEIMYQRYNAEHSEAYPSPAKASQVPLNFPIWKQKENCEKACKKINKQSNSKL